MVWRISNPVLINTSLRNMQTSLRQLQHTQEVLATGLAIRRPSDDPLGATTVLRLRADILKLDRYVANNDRAESFVNATDHALGIVNDLLIELREITVTEANDVGNAQSRQAAAEQVNAIIEQLIQTADSDFGGRYIFAGFQTETAPYFRSDTSVGYRGDAGLIYEEIGPGNLIAVNTPGMTAFSTYIGQVIGDVDLNPDISAGPDFDTPLAQLNGGEGVQAGSIVITDGSGAAATVDLSGAVTIGDVINAINAAGINVSASINHDGTGLLITDTTADPTLPLTVTEDPSATTTTAADLGILGSSMGSINGSNLDPIVAIPTVTNATPLSDLNYGAGVALGTFNVTDRDGNTVTVDVSGASTVGDVVAAINALTGPAFRVTASIAADGSGIDLSDTTSTGRSQITVTEAGGTTAADLGLLGTGFGTTLQGARLDPIGQSATPVSLLNGGLGISLGTIRITNGDLSASVDLSGAITVGNVLAAIERAGVRVDASVDSAGCRIIITSQTGDTPIVITSEGGTTAEGLGLFAPGLFETAEAVRQALLNNDAERLSALIADVDAINSRIIQVRAEAGQKMTQIEFARSRLLDLQLSFESLRAETEEADLTEFATKLVNQQTIYQAALATTVQVIQPTIFSFLR